MRKKGLLYEEIAVKYLENKFFEIVELNFFSRFGEIDIIAKKDNILHFIEVKSGKYDVPFKNFTNKKLEKISLTIDYFFTLEDNLKYENLNFSIDFLGINTETSNLKFTLIENITI